MISFHNLSTWKISQLSDQNMYCRSNFFHFFFPRDSKVMIQEDRCSPLHSWRRESFFGRMMLAKKTRRWSKMLRAAEKKSALEVHFTHMYKLCSLSCQKKGGVERWEESLAYLNFLNQILLFRSGLTQRECIWQLSVFFFYFSNMNEFSIRGQPWESPDPASLICNTASQFPPDDGRDKLQMEKTRFFL